MFGGSEILTYQKSAQECSARVVRAKFSAPHCECTFPPDHFVGVSKRAPTHSSTYHPMRTAGRTQFRATTRETGRARRRNASTTSATASAVGAASPPAARGAERTLKRSVMVWNTNWSCCSFSAKGDAGCEGCTFLSDRAICCRSPHKILVLRGSGSMCHPESDRGREIQRSSQPATPHA